MNEFWNYTLFNNTILDWAIDVRNILTFSACSYVY